MRFNDMIATVLAGSTERPEAREAQWRQLVDLLAQRQPGAPDAARGEAFAFLREQRAMIEPRIRAAVAASLAGLAIDPDLVVFFAEDRAEIAAPLLRSVRLGGDDWLRALPRLGPTARALLRHRRDLPREVKRALAGVRTLAISCSAGNRRSRRRPIRHTPSPARPSWRWSSGSRLFSVSAASRSRRPSRWVPTPFQSRPSAGRRGSRA